MGRNLIGFQVNTFHGWASVALFNFVKPLEAGNKSRKNKFKKVSIFLGHFGPSLGNRMAEPQEP